MSKNQQNLPVRNESGDTSQKTLVLKLDKASGKFILPISQLANVQIGTPAGFTATGLSIVASFSSTGVLLGLSDEPPKLRPLDDLQRLYQAPRLVGSVEALAERQEKTEEVQKTLFNIAQTLPKVEPTQTFKAEVIRLGLLKTILDSNLTEIEANGSSHSMNEIFRTFFRNQVKAIKRSFNLHLATLAEGLRERTPLMTVLGQFGVSRYIFNLLTGAKLNYSVLSPLRRLVFRSKVLKGWKLTSEEIRNEAIITAIGKELLAHSVPLLKAIMRINITVDLKLKTDNQVKIFNESEWFLVPVGDRLTDVRESSLGQPSVRPEVEQLWIFNRFLLERYLAITPQGYNITGWVSRSINGFEANLESTTNLREQIDVALKSPNADRFRDLSHYLDLKEDFDYYGQPAAESRTHLLGLQKWKLDIPMLRTDQQPVVDLLNTSGVMDKDPEYVKFLEKAAAKSIGLSKKRPFNRMAVSPLTAASQGLIRAIKGLDKLHTIATDVQDYLQGFIVDKLQDAAARLIFAAIEKSRSGHLELLPELNLENPSAEPGNEFVFNRL